MEVVVREVNASVFGQGIELFGMNKQRWQLKLLFADDIALVADSEENLYRLIYLFGRVCERTW